MKFCFFVSIKNRLCAWLTVDEGDFHTCTLRVPRKNTWIEVVLVLFNKWIFIGTNPSRWTMFNDKEKTIVF